MPLPEHIGQPKSLGHFLQHLADLPPWSWLYVPEATRQITFAVQCFPKTVDSRDMSESEADGFDASIAVNVRGVGSNPVRLIDCEGIRD
jgi:hypothetical protein